MSDVIVEDGTVVSGSNSYTTVSGIGIYAADHGLNSWSDSEVTDAMKEQALFKSMRYLESLSWKGKKLTQEQNLQFPRENLYDRNDFLVPTDEVPQEVIKAQCEAAVLFLPESKINLQPNLTRSDYAAEVEISDAISERWYNVGPVRDKSTAINDLLRGLIRSNLIVELKRS